MTACYEILILKKYNFVKNYGLNYCINNPALVYLEVSMTNYEVMSKIYPGEVMKKLITVFFILFLIKLMNLPCFSQKSMLGKGNHLETIATRFQPPGGFQRTPVLPGNYGHWLRNLPLLPEKSPVKDYLGKIRNTSNDTTIAAVVDYDIQGKKLEQCMDIIIRFRADFLRLRGRENEISFYLPVNFLLKWYDWKQGSRPHFQGIRLNLIQNNPPDSSEKSYEDYLWTIFYHSNTQTAYFNYPKVKLEDLQIGDFIVKKGSRGHAVLIVDLAVDRDGNKIALVGQGDTPARQFHILNNRNHHAWFPIDRAQEYPPLPIRKKMYWEGLRRFPD
jgi:hypothetical protein